MRESLARRSAFSAWLTVVACACSGGGAKPPAANGGDDGTSNEPTQTDTSSAHGADSRGPATQRDAGSSAPRGDGSEPDAAAHGPAFPAVTDFAKPGPFEVTSEVTDASCTVYRPTTLGDGGLLHPIIVWGNGTGAPTVEVYAGFFKQWASHGFVVAAAHTLTAGSGMEMLACLDWLDTQATTQGSPYEGHLALDIVGASGHSQGGGGTVMVGADPRVRATVPLQAWTGASTGAAEAQMHQTGPMFLVSGTADVIAAPDANQKPIFEASNVPTFWGTLDGGDHVSVALGNVDAYLGPTTAWFRLQLMGDESARSMFYGQDCGLCGDAKWMVQRKLMD